MRLVPFIILCSLLAVAGCKQGPAPTPSKAPPAPSQLNRADPDATVPSASVPGESPTPDLVTRETVATRAEDASNPVPDIEQLLDDVTTRQRCNIVMGCPSEAPLVALGEEAVGPIVARYESLGRPNYQKFHLLDMLGMIGSPAALPLLRRGLDEGHWEARTRAARAIGRIGVSTDLARLKEHLEATAERKDFAFRYALAFAIERLSGAGGREILLEALLPDSINSRNWGFTRVAVEAAAELGLQDACPLLRVAVNHRDTFLKKAAIEAVATLDCTEQELLGAVAAQLKGRVPSVRKAAGRTLKKQTGITFGTYEQWLKYVQQQEQ